MRDQEGCADRTSHHLQTTVPTTILPDSPDALESHLLAAKRPGELDKGFSFSLRRNMVYCPVPKAANSTIKYLLALCELGPMTKIARFDPGKDLHNHLSGPLLSPFFFENRQDILRDILIDGDYFRFTLVRNPFSRVLSCYLDRFQKKSMIYRYMQRQSVKYAMPYQLGEMIGFLDFLRLVAKIPSVAEMDQHVRPQYHQIHADIIPYDAVGRFESMATDVTAVLHRIYGSDIGDLPLTENRSPSVTSAGTKLRQYYCDESVAIVRELYDVDFKAFSYDTALPL